MANIKLLLGKKIKELRKKKGYTQAQLAEMVCVDDKHISCIENGKNFPSADLLDRISHSFGVEPKDLFEFNYLKDIDDIKNEVITMISTLSDNELVLTYKYISTFLLK